VDTAINSLFLSNVLSGQDDSAVKLSLLRASFWLSTEQAEPEERGERVTQDGT